MSNLEDIDDLKYRVERETLLGYSVVSAAHENAIHTLLSFYDRLLEDGSERDATPLLFRLNTSGDMSPKDIVTMNRLARSVVDFERSVA